MRAIYLKLFIIFFAFSFTSSYSQSNRLLKKLEIEGMGFYNTGELHHALPLFMKLDSLSPGRSEVNYHIGVCLLQGVYKKNALGYFKKAIKQGSPPAEIHYYLGVCYHLNNKFDKAIESFVTAKKHISDYHETLKVSEKDINHEIRMCKYAKELVKNPLDYKIEHLGESVNSEYPDYVPVISADEATLIFTSRRPDTQGEGKDFLDDLYFEDIYISQNEGGTWSTPQNMGETINSKTHDAAVGLSPDGQKLFIYHDDKKSSQDLAGNIFSSDWDGETWSEPVKMSDKINSDYWEPSASITADEHIMFFSSSKPGGKGGLDIYMAKKLPNGDWAEPINLEGVNTEYDDDAPFIHSDNRTLYFSSKGHKSMGGYDIFMAILNEENNTWSEPQNMGYPINTSDDDIYFVWTADGSKGYFSSVRNDSYGDKDIYVVHKPLAGTYFMVLKGTVLDKDTKEPLAATIKLYNENDEIDGVYNSRKSTGQFSAIVPPNKKFKLIISSLGYEETEEFVSTPDVKEYIEQEETFYLKNAIVSSDTSKAKYIPGYNLKTIYHGFDQAKHEGSSDNNILNVIDIMNKNPWMKISIESHTDSKGSEEYNEKLAERRASSAKMYLIRRGISGSRISVKTYGELKPAAPNEINGKDNPEGRAKNRRTEFIVVTNKPS